MKCCRTADRKKNARRDSLRPAIVAFISLGAGFLARAIPQETTLRSQSNLVLIPALVKDAQGEVVYGLEAKILSLKTMAWSNRPSRRSTRRPADLAGGRDSKRTAGRVRIPAHAGAEVDDDPLFAMGTARVAVVEFDSSGDSDPGFHQGREHGRRRSSEPAAGRRRGSDPGCCGYSVGLLKKEPEDRLRVLLLISETRDHGSQVKIEDAVADIGQSNSLMYALSFSPALSNILDTGRGNNIERDASDLRLSWTSLFEQRRR